MNHKVRLQRAAEEDLDDAYLWAAKRAPETASRWLRRFQETLESLALIQNVVDMLPSESA